ncbi:MAG: polysaccharide biosynthesis protein, partial [Sphaerochaeta sp.]|nr:polysaccharide biosynthesis protein [Sphaerochaeta sp.]
MNKITKGRIARQTLLMCIDAVLLFACSLLAVWIVFGEMPPLFCSLVFSNILALILLLSVVRFYRIRISESSLDLFNRGLEGFVPVFIIGVVLVGLYLG